MESKKVIRKYLGVAGWKRAMAWVFFAAMLVCLFFGIAGTGHDDTAEAESFYPADGVYAYVDAIGLSDWLYKVDSTVYYAAIDVYGNFYIVQLSSSTVDEMAAQRNYWDVESARAPAAYRLYGMTRSMDYETRSDIASVFDMDVAEFDKYFDIYCLDTGTSPSSDEAAMWIVFAMLAGLLWLCVAIVCGQTGKNLKRSLRRRSVR